MKWTRVFSVILLLSVLVGTASQVIAQAAFDTAFTCRGFLREHAMPVGQDKDFRFTLFDVDHSDPNHQTGDSVIAEDVEVDRGHFIVDVDFGAGPFTGEARWLLIEVRDWDSIDPIDFVEQDPLIRLTLSPYAIHAGSADYVQDGITGRGSAGSVPRFTDPNTIADSVIYENAGNVGIGTINPTEMLTVSGRIESTSGGFRFPDGTVQTSACPQGGNVPRGGIIMWSGSIADIPNGWWLCNGENDTPDLRNRFVVGASQDNGGFAMTNVKGSLMQAGGEHEHTLTIPEMPQHHHNYERHVRTCHFSGNTTCSVTDALETHTTEDTGGDQPHENCPPFYALAYIMRSLQ